MAEYKGSVELISGITPKSGGDFPLVEAKDVLMPDGTRLSEFNGGGTGSGGGSANLLIVALDDTQDSNFTTHSATEIYEHIQNGGMAVMDFGGSYWNLASCSQDAAFFYEIYAGDGDRAAIVIMVNEDKSWRMTQTKWYDDDASSQSGNNGVLVNTPTYAFAVTDKNGKVAFAVDKNGNVLDGRSNGLATKNVSNYAFAVTDKDGRVALGVTVDEHGEPVFDFVGKDKLSAAAPLKQNGNYDAEINMFICYGQSWSTGYDASAITTTPRYDNLMLDTGIMNNPLNDLTVAATSFAPAVEITGKSSPTGQTVGETPVTAQMHIVKQLMESEDGLTVNDLSYRLLGTAPGVGSATMAKLWKGTDWYDRLVNQVKKANELAADMGQRLVVQAFSWVQGSLGAFTEEQKTADPTLSSLTNYAEALERLRLDIDTDVKAITGQTQDVKCITWQSFMINKHVSAESVYNDYVGASETYPNIICAGATYQLDNIRDANLHLTAEHQDLMGALFGVAYKRTIIDGEKFEPLKPIGASHAGKILYVKFNVPQRPLVLDTESFDEATNKGFRLYAADGTEKAITDVAVISPDTVKIVCDENVVSEDHLVYVPNLINEIYAGDETIKFHWVSDCRGNLRDSQGDYIQYKSGNDGDTHPVLPVHNWCVIFDKTIGELED